MVRHMDPVHPLDPLDPMDPMYPMHPIHPIHPMHPKHPHLCNHTTSWHSPGSSQGTGRRSLRTCVEREGDRSTMEAAPLRKLLTHSTT